MVHIIIGLEPSDTRRKRKSPMDVDADEVWGLLILQRRKRRTKIWINYGTVWSFLIFRSFVFRKKYTGASYRPCRRRLPHGRKYKESGECFSPASAGGKRSRVYLYGLLRIWNLLYKGVKGRDTVA